MSSCASLCSAYRSEFTFVSVLEVSSSQTEPIFDNVDHFPALLVKQFFRLALFKILPGLDFFDLVARDCCF